MKLDDAFSAYLGWCPKYNVLPATEINENDSSYQSLFALFTLATVGMIGIAIVNVISSVKPFDRNIEVAQAFLYTGATLCGNFARIFWNSSQFKFSKSDLIQIFRVFVITFTFVAILSSIMWLALPQGSYWLSFPIVYFSYSLFIRVLGPRVLRNQIHSNLIQELSK